MEFIIGISIASALYFVIDAYSFYKKYKDFF